MCMNTSEFDLNHPFSSTTSGPSFRVYRLHRKRLLKQAKNKARRREGMLKRENMKLYMENKSIIEENEKLRKKATLLRQENRVLLSQLQNANFSQNHNMKACPSL